MKRRGLKVWMHNKVRAQGAARAQTQIRTRPASSRAAACRGGRCARRWAEEDTQSERCCRAARGGGRAAGAAGRAARSCGVTRVRRGRLRGGRAASRCGGAVGGHPVLLVFTGQIYGIRTKQHSGLHPTANTIRDEGPCAVVVSLKVQQLFVVLIFVCTEGSVFICGC